MSCILLLVLRPACEADLHMDDSFNELTKFPIWPLPETAMGVLCNSLLGTLPKTPRDTIIPLVRRKTFSIPHKRSNSAASCDRSPKPNGTLVVYCSSSCRERHVLQCRCQPTPTRPVYNIGGYFLAIIILPAQKVFSARVPRGQPQVMMK